MAINLSPIRGYLFYFFGRVSLFNAALMFGLWIKNSQINFNFGISKSRVDELHMNCNCLLKSSRVCRPLKYFLIIYCWILRVQCHDIFLVCNLITLHKWSWKQSMRFMSQNGTRARGTCERQIIPTLRDKFFFNFIIWIKCWLALKCLSLLLFLFGVRCDTQYAREKWHTS